MSVRIEHWGDEPNHRLEDSTPLWRYMKLSTFLLLLDGKVFFPSVQTLQKGDPLEGVFSMDPDWWQYVISHSDDRYGDLCSWLHKLAECGEPENQQPWQQFFECLRRQRAVWCWHESENESAALWSIYANAGIAVRTDVASLSEALPNCHDFQIARIKYLPRNPPPHPWFKWDPTDEACGLELVVRPHLLKGVEYAHEKEIRVSTFCLPKENGWCVDGIKPEKLIKEIVVSPLVSYDEYVALKQHLAASTGKWDETKIRYSVLLGDLEENERRAALVKSYFRCHKETDLPRPIDEL